MTNICNIIKVDTCRPYFPYTNVPLHIVETLLERHGTIVCIEKF